MASGGANFSYDWLFNNTPITNAKSQTYIARITGNYSVQVSDSFGCSTLSGDLMILARPAPVKPTITQTLDTLTSSLANNYQWFLNGNQILGANARFYVANQSGRYIVVVADSFNCRSTSDPYQYINIGFDEGKVFSVNVFPNPASKHLTISYNAHLMNELTMKLFTMDGKLIYSDLVRNNSTLILAQISSGIYILELSNSQVKIHKRLILTD
jgi:hypothetical protein